MDTTFRPEYLPAIPEIRDAFEDEIISLGGNISNVFDDGERLFVRAALALDAEVRPGDALRAGVAVRACGSDIVVHPYTVRQVCTNGAILARALESRRIERAQAVDVFLPAYDIAMTLRALRDTVRACAAKDVFEAATEDMRSTLDVQADIALHLLPALAHMPERLVAHLLPQIFGRFEADGERSVFGLLNAVTSVARDTADPETRWGLEEAGGSMPARLRQPSTVPAAGSGVSTRFLKFLIEDR